MASLLDRLLGRRDDLDDDELLLPSVSVLRLQPGDALVLSTDAPLSRDAIERIRAQLNRVAPGHPILVLQGGLRMSVVRSRDAALQPAPLDPPLAAPGPLQG